MEEFKFTIGIILLILNSSILISSILGIVLRLKSSKLSQTVKELDINYMVLFASMVFLFSNSFALYTGYKYYIKEGFTLTQDVMVARLIDRVGMFVVSVLLIFIGKNVSKNILEK